MKDNLAHAYGGIFYLTLSYEERVIVPPPL
jgi:hypothetical protein